MDNKKMVLILIITFMVCMTIIASTYIFASVYGEHIEYGLMRLGMGISNGLYNMPSGN